MNSRGTRAGVFCRWFAREEVAHTDNYHQRHVARWMTSCQRARWDWSWVPNARRTVGVSAGWSSWAAWTASHRPKRFMQTMPIAMCSREAAKHRKGAYSAEREQQRDGAISCCPSDSFWSLEYISRTGSLSREHEKVEPDGLIHYLRFRNDPIRSPTLRISRHCNTQASPTTSSSATTWSRDSSTSRPCIGLAIVMTNWRGASCRCRARQALSEVDISPRWRTTRETITDARHASSYSYHNDFSAVLFKSRKSGRTRRCWMRWTRERYRSESPCLNDVLRHKIQYIRSSRTPEICTPWRSAAGAVLWCVSSQSPLSASRATEIMIPATGSDVEGLVE